MVSKVIARQLQDGDLEVFEANLRQPDRDEVIALRGPDVLDALRKAVAVSDRVLVFEYRGKLLALFGVVTTSLIEQAGCPWMLGTTAVDKYPGALMFQGRRYIAEMMAEYRYLENYVDARNSKSIRWLRKLGFKIHEPVPLGLWKLPFHKFDMGA